MLLNILLFEIRYRLKRPATYIYFGLFFAFAFLLAIVAGGAFPEANISLGGSGGKVFMNSPYSTAMYTYILDYLGIIIIAAMVAGPVYRDFEYNTHSIFFTKPLSKLDYLGGRFIGSCIVTIFVLSGIALGLMFGTAMPFLDPDKIGPFHLINYIQPYFVIVIPNLLFMGMIFFMLATLTRNMLPVYVGSIVLLIFLGIASQLVKTISNEFISALLDPVGGQAIGYFTRYWTVAQKNTTMLPFSGVMLYNRLIWLGGAVALFAVLFARFRFDQFSSEWGAGRKMKAAIDKAGAYIATVVAVHQNFDLSAQLLQFRNTVKLEFKNIIKSPYFIAIAVAGMLFMFVSGAQFGKFYDTNTYPVTGKMAEGLLGVFGLFFTIIIVFYSGEMIWKERELKMSQIYDALPVPGWISFASKLTALIGLQVVLLFIIMLCGIIIQTCFGYYNYEPLVYIRELFGVRLIDLALFCVMALFIQTLVNQKYLGFFVVIAYYLFVNIFMDSLGWQHNLYKYASDPGMPYSDMNGYGHYLKGWLWFKLYWSAFAVMLAVIANIFWVRGVMDGYKARLRAAEARFTGGVRLTFILALLVFLGSGSYIFYNTNILNKYNTSFEDEKQSAKYEQTYKKLEHSPQPRIIAMSVNADIYPYERALHFKGYYILKNKTNKPVDSIQVLLSDFVRKHAISFQGFEDSAAPLAVSRDTSIQSTQALKVVVVRKKNPVPLSTQLVLKDTVNSYYIYKLPKSLMPQDSICLDFELSFAAKGFSNSGGNNSVCYNGTFVNSAECFPQIGYDPERELSDNIERKKFKLPYRELMASLGDTEAVKNNLISNDADWVRYDAVVSTSDDQTALTSGDLVKKWTENGRNYFQYKSDSRILCFVPFVSARYEIKEDHWNNIRLAIYYKKGHEYNLDRMMQALKDGLSYYTKNYSPYQFHEVKILEFPYASFAQSYANTIPFSENIGFVADVDTTDPSDVDFPYYVTAHELGHQWWAHQVIGGRVQGVTMLDETMAQYSALMIMKQKYGADKMKKFLRYEMDTYLRGRSLEREKEMPLYRVENQQYIHYNKGSVVMYALQDYIGEMKLDSALHKYIQKVGFQEPPYTTTPQFLDYVSAATPDSMKYIIKDMFKSIVLFNNKVTDATYTKVKDSTYKVHLVVEAKKIVADSKGNEKDTAINDWIDIGVFGRTKKGQSKPLYMRKMKITTSPMTFDLLVQGKPQEAGIDPYNKLIDRMPEDNTKAVEEAK
jgi:ABC-type transport system involved in multi-copper enzyme maturation permease subunit